MKSRWLLGCLFRVKMVAKVMKGGGYVVARVFRCSVGGCYGV